MKILALSDIHGDKSLIRRMAQRGAEEKVDLVILAGDIVDHNKNPLGMIGPFKEKEKPLKIGGVMDRVDVASDGSLEIVDYKTGATIPSQSEVDKNLQLTFYALASTSIREEPFNKLPEEVSLSLYFLDTQDKLTSKRTKEQLEEAVEEIHKVRQEIEESAFKCSGNFLCEKCEFSLFCRGDGQ